MFDINDGKNKGDIDLFIPPSEKNEKAYVIEMKYEEGAVTAIFQPILLYCYDAGFIS